MQIDSAVDSAEKLSLFPNTTIKIRTVVTSQDTSFDDLERAVAMDPALSAQVLKIANSPYFGVSRKVGHLRQALVLIGYEATRDLALALSLLSVCKRQTGPVTELWQHSLKAALVAKMLCDRVSPELSGEAFVAGLLHDIGKLIACLIRDGDLFAVGAARSTPASLVEEKDQDGFDHAELGAACLERWNLSEVTCLGIRHHHRPTEIDAPGPGGLLGRILFVANDAAHEYDRPDADWAQLVQTADLQES